MRGKVEVIVSGEYRTEVDWARLEQEGMRLEIGGHPVTALVVPFDQGTDRIVVMVPCAKAKTREIRANLQKYLTIIKSLGPLIRVMMGR